MAFSPSLSRLISRRTLAGASNLFKSTTLTRRMISTAPAPIEPVNSSPWMMLPPSFNGDSVSYNFYSLAENSIRTLPQTELTDFGPNPTRDVFISGSSRGWLAIFNRENPDVFLYDPISLRRINLPPIENLPKNPTCNTFVHKLILTSTPFDPSCRAVMICNYALYFCCPRGTTDEWALIGDASQKRYEDIVYSEKQNLIFTLDSNNDLETFDLTDPSSPSKRVKKLEDDSSSSSSSDSSDRERELVVGYSSYDDDEFENSSDWSMKELSDSYRCLAVADDLYSDGKDDVLLVTRYMLDGTAPDDDDYFGRCYRHQTFDFDVEVYDREDKSTLKGLLDSLGDRAVFIGPPSESVVLSASRFPELKPNSIYFTDRFETALNKYRVSSFRGDDVGIFNYGNKTVSSCYYPCDVQRLKPIVPSPVWFHPRGPI